MPSFDYEEAELDLLENGCDPDCLSSRDPMKRDAYLRKCGLNPKSYGGGLSDSDVRDFLSQEVQKALKAKQDERLLRDAIFHLPTYLSLLFYVFVFVAALCICAVPMLLISELIMASTPSTDVFLSHPVPVRVTIFFGFCFLLVYCINPKGVRKFLHKTWYWLGAPFRPLRRWYRKDRLAMLSFLAGFMIGLILIAAWFIFTF